MYKVIMIGGADSRLTLRERVQIIDHLRSGILISIHHDSVQPRYLEVWHYGERRLDYSDRFRGFSVFVSREGSWFFESRRLGTAIGLALLEAGFHPSFHHSEAVSGEQRPLLDARIALTGFDELAVLRNAKVPAVLIEVGIIKNRLEEVELLDSTMSVQRGRAVALGIVDYVEKYCQK